MPRRCVTWHDRLKAEVPLDEIPQYLVALQGLVAALRRWRDDLKVPEPEDVRPHLSPILCKHPRLTADYIDDVRYADVVRRALE